MPYVMPAAVPVAEAGELGIDVTLPGLRGLSRLADLRPTIAVDTREQTPLVFTRLQSVTKALLSGDYSVCGLEDLMAIERKTIDDLANCCLAAQSDRFENELHRLRGYRFKRLLVIGTREDIAAGHYHSRIAPKAVLATLGAFEVRYDLPVFFAETPEVAARLVERWAALSLRARLCRTLRHYPMRRSELLLHPTFQTFSLSATSFAAARAPLNSSSHFAPTVILVSSHTKTLFPKRRINQARISYPTLSTRESLAIPCESDQTKASVDSRNRAGHRQFSSTANMSG